MNDGGSVYHIYQGGLQASDKGFEDAADMALHYLWDDGKTRIGPPTHDSSRRRSLHRGQMLEAFNRITVPFARRRIRRFRGICAARGVQDDT